MRLYLMPASGLNSKVVTTGPGLICVMWPPTSNSMHFCFDGAGALLQFGLVHLFAALGPGEQAKATAACKLVLPVRDLRLGRLLLRGRRCG